MLYGPLTMFPANFDNYGLEFCSLLVLPSTPNVLVVGNSKGFLHHCVFMDNPDVDNNIDSICDSSASDIDVSNYKIKILG